jgi:hypothetical protein
VCKCNRNRVALLSFTIVEILLLILLVCTPLFFFPGSPSKSLESKIPGVFTARPSSFTLVPLSSDSSRAVLPVDDN